MKKYLALLLAGVMMLSLVACGEKQTTDDEQTGNEAGNGSLSSIVDLNTDWLPYDENGNLKLTERDAEGKNGVVTSANYYASKIGEKIIEQGGNAIDAAVAMGFAMSTVESYYSGLGGGGYMLIRFAETGETCSSTSVRRLRRVRILTGGRRTRMVPGAAIMICSFHLRELLFRGMSRV